MKHHHSPRGGRFLILGIACLGLSGQAFAGKKDNRDTTTPPTESGTTVSADTGTQAIPRGTLTVDSTLVRVGTQSQLSWQIQYPEIVTDIIEVIPPSVIKSKSTVKMRVRVLGASFQQSSTKYLPVEVMWSKNNSSWSRMFYGRQTDVNAAKVVLETTINKGDVINFGGRGYRYGSWLPLYNTSADSPNLVMLKNGDKVPSTTPAFQQGLIESFLAPYLSSDKRTVKIGNRDLILLLELGQTNPKVSGFDLQDLVVLVTFD